MNEDEMQALEPLAGEELERQLARYARVRLDPTPAQSRRARTAVMEAAWRRRLHGDAPPASAAAKRPSRRGLFATWSVRRLGTSLAAAVLAGLTVGSVAFATTRAGGPLYEARLSFEALTLPSEPGARLEAELAQAQTRLAELVEAVGRSDQAAIEAALSAYERSLADLAATTGGPADRALEAVQFHRAVLLGLMDRVPAQARGGIEHALQQSSGAIDRLGTAGGGAGQGGAGQGSPGQGGPAGPGKGAAPGTGDGPAASDGPDRTPNPGRTPAVEETPKPTKPPKSPNPNSVRTPGPATNQSNDDPEDEP